MIETLASLYIAEDGKKHSRGKDFRSMCRQLAIFKVAFKNPAFSEEKEVRSIHLLTVNSDDDMPRLKDEGGLILGKTPVVGQEVKYRTRGDGLIAYIDIPHHDDRGAAPNKRRLIGAKEPEFAGKYHLHDGWL
jgi:hypothetical protein